MVILAVYVGALLFIVLVLMVTIIHNLIKRMATLEEAIAIKDGIGRFRPPLRLFKDGTPFVLEGEPCTSKDGAIMLLTQRPRTALLCPLTEAFEIHFAYAEPRKVQIGVLWVEAIANLLEEVNQEYIDKTLNRTPNSNVFELRKKYLTQREAVFQKIKDRVKYEEYLKNGLVIGIGPDGNGEDGFDPRKYHLA